MSRLAAGWSWEAKRAIRELQVHRPEAALPHLLFAIAARSEPNRAARHCFDATQRLASSSAAERAVIEAYRVYFGVTEQPELVDPRFESPPPEPRQQQLKRALANVASLAGNRLAVELLAVEAASGPRAVGGADSAPPQLVDLAVVEVAVSDAAGVDAAGVDAAGAGAGVARDELSLAAITRANDYLSQRGTMPFLLPGYRTSGAAASAIAAAAARKGIGQPLRLDRLPRHPDYPQDEPTAGRDLLSRMSSMPMADAAGAQVNWQPRIAPGYKLSRGLGGTAERAALRGKPHLVVFFLGFGCAHCVAQLADLDPMAAKFRAAGIEVVSIGTDSVVQVRAAHQAAMENGVDPLHFDVLCDPAGTAFRSFGCWDEFADEALHGTFLVDGKDRILWQDVSLRPFEDSKWLLAECQRLLAAWRDE